MLLFIAGAWEQPADSPRKHASRRTCEQSSNDAMQDPVEGVDAARAFFRNTWNAQRSQVSSRLPQAGKPGATSEAPRPLSAAQRAAQLAPGTPKMHVPAANHNGWPPVQVRLLLSGYETLQVLTLAMLCIPVLESI